MNSISKKGVAFAIAIIAIGVAWLLNVLGVMPGVNWIWTGALGIVGVLVLALAGMNQLTVIVGPFLVVGSLLSVLRQTGRMSVDVEVPVLVICFGILTLASYALKLPLPRYLQREDDEKD